MNRTAKRMACNSRQTYKLRKLEEEMAKIPLVEWQGIQSEQLTLYKYCWQKIKTEKRTDLLNDYTLKLYHLLRLHSAKTTGDHHFWIIKFCNNIFS